MVSYAQWQGFGLVLDASQQNSDVSVALAAIRHHQSRGRGLQHQVRNPGARQRSIRSRSTLDARPRQNAATSPVGSARTLRGGPFKRDQRAAAPSFDSLPVRPRRAVEISVEDSLLAGHELHHHAPFTPGKREGPIYLSISDMVTLVDARLYSSVTSTDALSLVFHNAHEDAVNNRSGDRLMSNPFA